MRLHTELTDRQMRECGGLTPPERVLLESADQQRQQAANQEVAARVKSRDRTWGQLLLGSPVKPPRI